MPNALLLISMCYLKLSFVRRRTLRHKKTPQMLLISRPGFLLSRRTWRWSSDDEAREQSTEVRFALMLFQEGKKKESCMFTNCLSKLQKRIPLPISQTLITPAAIQLEPWTPAANWTFVCISPSNSFRLLWWRFVSLLSLGLYSVRLILLPSGSLILVDVIYPPPPPPKKKHIMQYFLSNHLWSWPWS